MPPIWAIVAMVVLGWNEFFAALRNPLWLICGVLLFLFFKVACSLPVLQMMPAQESCRKWVMTSRVVLLMELPRSGCCWALQQII